MPQDLIIDIPKELSVERGFSRVCLWFENPTDARTFELLLLNAQRDGRPITLQFK